MDYCWCGTIANVRCVRCEQPLCFSHHGISRVPPGHRCLACAATEIRQRLLPDECWIADWLPSADLKDVTGPPPPGNWKSFYRAMARLMPEEAEKVPLERTVSIQKDFDGLEVLYEIARSATTVDGWVISDSRATYDARDRVVLSKSGSRLMERREKKVFRSHLYRGVLRSANPDNRFEYEARFLISRVA